MAITTLHSHVQRALDFYNKDNIYFCIGRSTPWDDENSPPEPEFDTQQIEEIIGFKRAEVINLVTPDDEGEIQYQESGWKIVSEEDAFTEEARYVFLSTTIMYNELPLGRYRQIGIYTNLVAESSVPGGRFVLTPEEVQHTGTLEVIDNRQDSNRQADQKETLNLIIKM